MCMRPTKDITVRQGRRFNRTISPPIWEPHQTKITRSGRHIDQVAGQTCVCANRILVQDGVYDSFTKRLAETAGAMKVADGFEPGAVIRPLIDMKAVEKVEAHIADAVKKGAQVVIGGKRAAQGGTFFELMVLTNITTNMVITKEETFGPVAPLYRFKSEDEAVKMAND